MTACEQVEYRALRATIRERGTARVYIFAGGIAAWGALTIATAALASTPLATLLPLLVLTAVFEAVFALHVGVERIGRYLQVFHETEDTGARWEHVAMAFGRPVGAPTADALFSVTFLLAALFNVAPALIVQPTIQELIFVGGAHALFLVRLAVAREAARRQRAIDLRRFEELKQAALP
jgi:prolipoprotein diacylglyceryltransferase